MKSGKSGFDVGRIGEEYVTKLLRNAGLSVEPNRARSLGKLCQWDLESKLDDRTFTLEVKFDNMQTRTGNVAVEHYNTKSCKPSGIRASTADLWAYVFMPLSAFLCRRSDLVHFVDTVRPHRDISSGGDDNAALHLYRRDVILPTVFRPMDDLTPDEFRGLLRELL